MKKNEHELKLTPENQLLLQSYYMTVFLEELHEKKFLESMCFENMDFRNMGLSVPQFKDDLKKIGLVNNRGSLLMHLYTMLAIPRQLLGKKFDEKLKSEFRNINNFLRHETMDTETSYEFEDVSNRMSINYLWHIRNSVVHCRIDSKPDNFFTFYDERWNKEKRSKDTFSTSLSLKNIKKFIMRLQQIHLSYILTSNGA